MKAYKFFHLATAAETIARMREIIDEPYVWASPATEFNDPFELKVSLDWPKTIEDARERFFKDHPNSTDADLCAWFEGLTPQSKWYISKQVRQGLIDSHSIVCVSKNFNNHLLWSHYAHKHEGVCIEVDLSNIQGAKDYAFQGSVDYSKNKPKFNYFRDSGADMINSIFLHKSIEWKYEEEHRVVFESPGKKLLGVPIRNIYLGCRAEPEIRKFAEEVQRAGELNFHQMIEGSFEYILEHRPVKVGTIYMSSFF